MHIYSRGIDQSYLLAEDVSQSIISLITEIHGVYQVAQPS